MGYDWIQEVIRDMAEFAGENDLTRSELALRAAAVVVEAELVRKGVALPPEARDEDLALDHSTL